MNSNWKEISTQKRKEIFSKIPPEWIINEIPSRESQKDVTGDYICQFLGAKEVEITETDAVDIAQRLASGQWKAVDVTRAFCHRAALAHQLTPCLLEIFFDRALERAQELDDYFSRNGRPSGILHGLPISLKDQFHVNGVETSMAYVGWIGTFQGLKDTGLEKQFESELTKELLDMGAILYCKTSVPHTLLTADTDNNIIGYTYNPRNRLLSCGGSSGGEGALISLRGSPLGFGTDIGGSVRIPSAFNGLFGLRPSTGRIPYEGAANSLDGQSDVPSVVGPISSSVESLEFAFKAVLSREPWRHDPLCLELPWREYKYQSAVGSCNSKLAIGIMSHDGLRQPHPPIQRAISILQKTLETRGHEVHPWTPPIPHAELLQIGSSSIVNDGGTDIHAALALSGEPMVPSLAGMLGPRPTAELTASQINRNNVRKRAARKTYLDGWNRTASITSTGRALDAIVCPAAPCAAAIPNTLTILSYTACWNVLDYAVVVVPVTRVDKTVDVLDGSITPLNDEDKKSLDLYDPEIFDGAPVGLQLVFGRLEEEKAVAIAKYISHALREDSLSAVANDDKQ